MSSETWCALVAAIAAAACGGGGSTDIDPTLRFAELTDAEISRLVGAALGNEMFQAQSVVYSFDDPLAGDCPAQSVVGKTVTLTGGCTNGDGTVIGGSAEIENPLDWGDGLVEYEYGDTQRYLFSLFSIDYGGYAITYDGRLTIGSSFTEYDADLTVTQLGASLRSDLFFSCGSSSCSISGSGVELIGKGGALVSGAIRVAGGASADVVLEGDDDTVIAELAGGCTHWELADAGRGNAPCP